MEYSSPLWAGAPASHLSRLHPVETKAFRIIGISHDVSESLGLSLSLTAGRSVVCLSFTVSYLASPLPSLLSLIDTPPPIFLQGARGPPATPFW